MTTRPTPIDIDDPSRPAPLSAAGRARRDAMLAELQGAVVGAARRRRAFRAAAIIAPPVLAIAAAFAILSSTPSPAPRPTAGAHKPAAPALPTESPITAPAAGREAPSEYTMRHANFQIIDAPPSARIVTGPPLHARTISDDELLHILHAAGHDVGLIRAGRRVILTDNRPDDDDGPSSRLDPAPSEPLGDPAV